MKNRGSIYFMTLASSIVLVMAIMGLSFTLIQFRRETQSNQKIDQAHIYTELGIRHALYFTHETPNWRNLLNSGRWLQDISNGNATYSVDGIDAIDGQLNNGNTTVQLTCTSTINGVNRTLTVQAEQPPLNALRYAITAGQTITLTNKSGINGDVACNGNIDKSGSSTFINGNVEIVGTINQTDNISGSITTVIEPKTFPYSPSIISHYSSLATSIGFQATLENFVLSPETNPFGPTNPYGIYKINCGGQEITIRDCRLVGTLILINPDPDSRIVSGINFQPAHSDYPVLIIKGSINILPNAEVDESSVNLDLSLPGEPGFGSMNDTYPNLIQGAIYCDGDLFLDQQCNIYGTIIVTGTVEMKSESQITADETLWDSPPLQFNESYLEPTQDSWQETVF